MNAFSASDNQGAEKRKFTLHGRIRPIDGLRGISAVAVVLYHAILHYDDSLTATIVDPPITYFRTGYEVLAKLLMTVLNGEYPVILFFLISGFVLQRSLDQFESLDWNAAARFGVKRVFRLMPAIFVSVTLLYLFLALGNPITNINGDRSAPSLSAFLENLFLFDTQLLGVTWTIRIEMIVTPFIFLFALIGRRLGFVGPIFVMIYALFALQNPGLTFSIVMLHSSLLPFSVGMLAANRNLAVQIPFPNVTVALCILGFLFARFFVFREQIVALISQVLFGGLLLNILANTPNTLLARFLSLPRIQFLGRISYSYYLYAEVVGIYVTFALSFFLKPPKMYAIPYGLAVGTGICILTIPVAALAERYVEQPGIAIGARLASGFRRGNKRKSHGLLASEPSAVE